MRLVTLRAEERLQRALQSLEGLAIGDALGEMLAARAGKAFELAEADLLPSGPWFHTDDTEMAIAIVQTLAAAGQIHNDTLAMRFVQRYQLDPDRGYGSGTRRQLQQMADGESWQITSSSAFGGQGSKGNGGAMRVAPVGAFFFDDMERVIRAAETSCIVTHSHPEAIAGSIAVAVAAAAAFRLRENLNSLAASRLMEQVLQHTPESEVREGLVLASQLPGATPIREAALALGNGSLVTAPDTVPLAIWCASHHLHDYRRAVLTVISANGDCDTLAAIVGGIVALSAGREGIPKHWRSAKEKLPFAIEPEANPVAGMGSAA